MRIVLINQFHPPAVAPTGQVMADLARTLVARHHEVVVLCAQDGYDDGTSNLSPDEMVDGYRVIRLPILGGGRAKAGSRVAGYGSFIAAVSTWLAVHRADLVVPLTTPPFLGLAARIAQARGARVAHWIMDLYPDVLEAHGVLRPGSLGMRALGVLARQQCAGACLVLTLGPSMTRRTQRLLGPGVRVEDVPLWGDGTLEPWPTATPNPLREQRGWKDDELTLLYSGNLGLGHRAQEFLQAAASSPPRTRWVFSGGGGRRHEVDSFRASHPGSPIEVAPYVALRDLRAHLSSADVHLASLDPEWQGCMVPSKLPSSFRVGKPVIFVGGRDNEIAAWIVESGGGWVVDCDDIAGLSAAVEEARDPVERARRGAAAVAFARKHFDRDTNCQRIASLLEEACR